MYESPSNFSHSELSHRFRSLHGDSQIVRYDTKAQKLYNRYQNVRTSTFIFCLFSVDPFQMIMFVWAIVSELLFYECCYPCLKNVFLLKIVYHACICILPSSWDKKDYIGSKYFSIFPIKLCFCYYIDN